MGWGLKNWWVAWGCEVVGMGFGGDGKGGAGLDYFIIVW